MFYLGNGSVPKLGQWITLGKGLPKEYGKPGESFKVVRISKEHEAVGIKSKIERHGWHDLDGELPNYGYGFWIQKDALEHYLPQGFKTGYVVNKDLEHRGIQLKNKNCNLLFKTITGEYMVEFEENIGGLSGDGKGKMGHCLAVNPKFLALESKKNTKNN